MLLANEKVWVYVFYIAFKSTDSHLLANQKLKLALIIDNLVRKFVINVDQTGKLFLLMLLVGFTDHLVQAISICFLYSGF